MKRTLVIVGLVLAIVWCAVTPGRAQEAKTIRVNIPFAFQVGKELLPAGQYVIEVDRVAPGTSLGSRLILRSSDGKNAHLLTAVPGHAGARRQPAGLSFRRYNQTYFLAKVNTSDTDCQLIKSPAEKQLSARITHEDVVARAE